MDGEVINIVKSVIFDIPYDGITNMSLVDVQEDGIHRDDVRSGLGKSEQIFATTAQVVYTFLKENNEELVYFEGSDPEGVIDEFNGLSLRQRLYNRFLSREGNYDLATNYFIIYGVYSGGIRIFTPNSSAEAFLIKLK